MDVMEQRYMPLCEGWALFTRMEKFPFLYSSGKAVAKALPVKLCSIFTTTLSSWSIQKTLGIVCRSPASV